MRSPRPRSVSLFLIVAVAILATRTTASDRPRAQARDSRENPAIFDAVIVGAGWAALKAARTLLESGISAILVLEANDYIGGRSKCVNSDGSINAPDLVGKVANVPFDLGTEWQYLADGDMGEYLRESGFFDDVDLDALEVEDSEPMASARFYRQSTDAFGNITADAMDDAEAADLRARVWGGFMKFRSETLDTIDDRDYFSAAEEYKAQYLTDERDIQFLNLFLDYGTVDHSGRLGEMSLRDSPTWGHSDGFPVHYMSVPGAGYGNLAAKFSAPLFSKIKLGAKVTKIDYADEGTITVSFTENEVARVVAAKTVLVTASLGVLKAGVIEFTPRLPDWKQDVVDNMGFGLSNKIVMQWNDADAMVWPAEALGFELVTSSPDTSGKWTTFFNPSQFKGAPVLEGQIGADDAREMEKQTDGEIMEDVMTNLRAMFPTITNPDRIAISRWGQEEHVRGAYAFKVVGRDFEDDTLRLQRNLNKKVWFAGEAMSGTWYGTAVGAWETGEEAGLKMAEEIAQLGITSAEPPSSFEGTATMAAMASPVTTVDPVATDAPTTDAPVCDGSCVADHDHSVRHWIEALPTAESLYLDGAWRAPHPADDRGAIDVVDPSTGRKIAAVAVASRSDVDLAVAAARQALAGWSLGTALAERRRFVVNLLALYEDHAEQMAQLMTHEMGAPIEFSRDAQVGSGSYAMEQFLHETGEGGKFESAYVPAYDEDTTIFHQAIGVVGLITPWNWPMNQIALKVIPALLVGCTVVLKPSEETPLSALLFGQLIHKAGFPSGVFQLVNGYGPSHVGEWLAAHPGVDMVSFTGSTRAGKQVSAAAAPTLKRVSLEMGGKGANIIFDDLVNGDDLEDFREAVEAGVDDVMNNSGQTCNAPTRMLIPAQYWQVALEVAKETALQTQVRSAHVEGDHIGPVVSESQYERIQSYIRTGIEQGATLLAGGLGKPAMKDDHDGYYVRPTIFADCSPEMTIWKEEIFGPVLCMTRFSTEDEAIGLANDSPYGLTHYAHTYNVSRRRRLAQKLESGMIVMNQVELAGASPFGGVKQSGNSREGGVWGLEDFCIVKAVSGLNGEGGN